MFYEIIELGRLSKEKSIAADLFTRDTNAILIVIEFDDACNYIGCSLEHFDPEKKEKYLYMKKASNGPDFSPTAKVTEIKKKRRKL
jgi:hypothetical protein